MTLSTRTRNKSNANSASASGVFRVYAVVNQSAHRNDIGMACKEAKRGKWKILNQNSDWRGREMEHELARVSLSVIEDVSMVDGFKPLNYTTNICAFETGNGT